LSTYSALFMPTERTLLGTHFDAFGTYNLQISDHTIYEILWHFVTVILKTIFREFPSRFILIFFHYPCCRTKWNTYRPFYVRNSIKYGSFVAEIFSPCLSWLLTATVIVSSIRPSDGMDFKKLYLIRSFQITMEIRISGDYCRSNIYLADYGNITHRHISKITPSLLKKFELCSFVSNT